MRHKSLTSYFPLLLTSSKALITLSQRPDRFRCKLVKSKATTLKNRWKNTVANENNDGLRVIR